MREQNIKKFAKEQKTQDKKLGEQNQKTLLSVPANRIKVLKLNTFNSVSNVDKFNVEQWSYFQNIGRN